ncbi:MAG: recombinase family protein, partial [Candidatus Uhrbacteria bacterium]
METYQNNTAIVYCRVSSKEQVEGTSLESQEHCCREYAARQGMEISRVFVEMGESAKTADRPELLGAVSYCSKNKVGYFIVYKVDRFARNQDDHTVLRSALKKSGTKLRSATEQISEAPIGRMLEGIMSTFAEFDNSVRAERSKGGMVERVKQGVWVWAAPFGYCRPPKALNIAPEEETAHHVRFAFEEYAKGVYTYKQVADLLGKRGCLTRGGKPPIPQMVQKMLRNPIYYGIIRAFDQETKGGFEPVISESLFWKCQKDRTERTEIVPPRVANNPTFPLRKFVVCDLCKAPITGSSSRGRQGKKYSYYHHGHSNCAKSISVPKGKFEQMFVEFLSSIMPNPRYEKLFKAIIIDKWQENYKLMDVESTKTQKEIDRLKQDRQRVFDLHRSGSYTDNEFSEQKAVILRQIDQKRFVLESQRVEEFNMEEALDYCFNYVRNTATRWVDMKDDYPKRIRFQKLILKKEIEFDGEKFGNTELSLIYKLKETSRDEKSLLVNQPPSVWNQILEELKQL